MWNRPTAAGASGSASRFLFHHAPMALVSAGLLVVFMTVPLFDTATYPHLDLVSGRFPRVGTEPESARRDGDHAAESTASSPAGRHDGGSHHHGRQVRTTRHGGHDGSGDDHDRVNRSGEDQWNVLRSRQVQQFTVASGYLAVAMLAVTLLLGPANLVLRRRNPLSTYLRRDVGIWTAAFSILHVISAILIHVSHGSGVITSVLHFFVAEDGRPLTNSFGWGNWTGSAALLIVLGLLTTSSDAALRMLKARPWKWLQRLTYALFVLVVLHAVFYGALLRMPSPFTLLLVLSVVAVLVGQLVGVWLWRHRRASSASLA